MTGGRLRADRLLVERGLFDSRARAQGAIRAGLVSADGRPVTRASDVLDAQAQIEASAAHPYVSRGGVKLAAALDAFALDPAGEACLDVGASTGGFTQVLLERGASSVAAVDVGQGQLHPSLREDTRVTNREATDIRSIAPGALAPAPTFVTVDVSFIALRLVLPALVPHLADRTRLVALIKPQFEAGRAHVGRGGIVRDEGVHDAVCGDVRARLEGLGFTILGLVPSPVDGGDGNREFLIGAIRSCA